MKIKIVLEVQHLDLADFLQDLYCKLLTMGKQFIKRVKGAASGFFEETWK